MIGILRRARRDISADLKRDELRKHYVETAADGDGRIVPRDRERVERRSANGDAGKIETGAQRNSDRRSRADGGPAYQRMGVVPADDRVVGFELIGDHARAPLCWSGNDLTLAWFRMQPYGSAGATTGGAGRNVRRNQR